MKRIIVDLTRLSPAAKKLDEYERCYNCNLFIDRKTPWEMDYDSQGNYVPQKFRKPSFEDPIAKEIVDSTTASIFGYNKFPIITFKTTKDIYEETDLIQKELECGELDEEDINDLDEREKKKLKIKLSNEQLRKFSSSILNSTFLSPQMLEASRLALIMGRSIIFIKVIDGVYYLEVINYKWVKNLKMDDLIPNKINSFSEIYKYEDESESEDNMEPKYYWYRRDFTEDAEIIYHPIEDQDYGKSDWRVKSKFVHDLGFCPAVMVETQNAKSIFNGQLNNIISYIYLTNNIYKGVSQNMNPQWVLTTAGEEDSLTHRNSTPKRMGGIWVFPGARTITPMSPDTSGYDAARSLRKDLKQSILKSCRVQEDLSPSNQQSGAALMVRFDPVIGAINEYRSCFGDKSLVKICEMIINMSIIYKKRGQEILIRNDSIIPDSNDFIVLLSWGEPTQVTEETIMQAVTNAVAAKKGGLIDKHTAAKYTERFFGVIDLDDMLKKIEEEQEEEFDVVSAKQMYGETKPQTQQIENSKEEID